MEQVLASKPKLVMGLVPCLNQYFIDKAWKVVKPYVQKIADLTQGEYDIYKVWQDMYFGQAHLYMCYEHTGDDIIPEKFQEKFINCLQTPEVGFVGYAIIRFEPKNAHIWQAFITEKHQNTDTLKLCFDYIEKVVKDVGAPCLTFSTQRKGWSVMCQQLEFSETYTVYRKELK